MSAIGLIKRIKRQELLAKNADYIAKKKLYLIGEVKERIATGNENSIVLSLNNDDNYLNATKELGEVAAELDLNMSKSNPCESVKRGEGILSYNLIFEFIEE